MRGLLITYFPTLLPKSHHSLSLVNFEVRFFESVLSFLILLKLHEFLSLSLSCPPKCSSLIPLWDTRILFLKQIFNPFTPIENLCGLIVLSS